MAKIFRLMILTITILVLALFSAPLSIAEGVDIKIYPLKFYGYFKGEKNVTYYIDDKVVKVKEGETLRHEFNGFNSAEGVITNIMDVEAAIFNQGVESVASIEIKFSIVPKVARFIYVKDYPEKLPSYSETEHTATWFAPIIFKRQTISKLNPKSSTKIVFKKINLQKIVDGYAKKERWPMELKFVVSVNLQGYDGKLSKDTTSRVLKIPLPAY